MRIPDSELTYRATRSGGPGGQHVNTSSTRVELVWNAAASPSITDEERARILEKLGNRIDADGDLRLFESGSRSQARNKAAVTQRFHELIESALRVPKRRRPTRPPPGAKEARLRAKKRRSDVKRGRGKVDEPE